MFIFAFIYVNRGIYFIYSGIALVLFCVVNKLTEKNIRCDEGYNLLQACLFYLRCEKNGISIKVGKIKDEDMKIISSVASAYDFCEKFTDAQLKELYRLGRETAVSLKQLKERKD
jgi:hypothetical protein